MYQKKVFYAVNLFAMVFSGFIFAVGQSARPDFNRPQSFDVRHYILRVSFERSGKKVIGDTTVVLKPLKPGFSEIELDAAGLAFRSVKLEPGGTNLKYRVANGKIFVTLDRAYTPDESISVRFNYSATPKKGIYFVDKEVENGKDVHSAQIWTQGEPDEAHHWFPSFDFPSDKATTEQFITVRKGETVIGNGELVGQKDNPDGTVTFHYKMLVPHSTYLVSFVVGNYVRVNEKYKDIPLGFYVYPGREAIVPKAYGKTKDILRVFEELTRISYPFNKYDQTIVSDFTFGGMENITATTMADSEIFLADLDFGKSAVENLVSHEAAHSWFGNLVTCKNWAELWLNEGFATFMEAAFQEKMYGRDAYIRKIKADAELFLIDDAVNPKRNGLFNRNAGNISALFDRPATTYNKGGAVIHMLRETIGDEAFWKGVNLYLNRHKQANVESTDLKNIMEEVSGKKLDWFFEQWVYGTGSPKLSVTQAYDPKIGILKLTVTQTQKSDKFTPAAYRLPMDLEITTENDSKIEKLEITKLSETFSFNTDGIPISLKLDKAEKIPIKTVKISQLK
ncbi:MAG: hypothetical protein M3Q26_06550 [Acidobacteriota bacterium]|nr:hypothetical protein [Acidobacteriota bacterium]